MDDEGTEEVTASFSGFSQLASEKSPGIFVQYYILQTPYIQAIFSIRLWKTTYYN
jgi:hypothetical protein